MKCELRLLCRGRKADGIIQPVRYFPPGTQNMTIYIGSVKYFMPQRGIGGKYCCKECGTHIFNEERKLIWTIGTS